MTETNNIFAERLKTARTVAGLSQAALAEALSDGHTTINKGMISKWENGLGHPSFDNLRRIAAFFQRSLDYFAGTDLVTPAEGGAVLRTKRQDAGYTIAQAAHAVHISPEDLKKAESGLPIIAESHTKLLQLYAVTPLLDFDKIDKDNMDFDKIVHFEEKPAATPTVPVLGKLAPDAPLFDDAHILARIPLTIPELQRDAERIFALREKTADTETLYFVRIQPDVEDKALAAVLLPGEKSAPTAPLLRRIQHAAPNLLLYTDSGEPPQIVDEKDLRILGHVTHIITNRKVF